MMTQSIIVLPMLESKWSAGNASLGESLLSRLSNAGGSAVRVGPEPETLTHQSAVNGSQGNNLVLVKINTTWLQLGILHQSQISWVPFTPTN